MNYECTDYISKEQGNYFLKAIENDENDVIKIILIQAVFKLVYLIIEVILQAQYKRAENTLLNWENNKNRKLWSWHYKQYHTLAKTSVKLHYLCHENE